MRGLNVMDIQYKSSAKAKNIRITVKGRGEVTVTVPKGISSKQAEAFVQKNMNWIEAKVAEANEKKGDKISEYGFGTEFKTKLTKIRVIETDGLNAFLKQHKDFLGIFIPEETDLSKPEWQELIKNQIEAQLRREAKYYLLKRTRELASQKDIAIGKVSVRSSKSRWGSCSHKNDISLSIYLMTLPDELIDYVICHELAHVKEKNHSKAFWNHLELLLPGAGKLDKEMKKYTTSVL
jgi:predicted metal-dependent hydrolase